MVWVLQVLDIYAVENIVYCVLADHLLNSELAGMRTTGMVNKTF